MKTVFISFMAAAAIFILSGCIKDTCNATFTSTIYEPLYKTLAEVRANIKSNPSQDIKAPGKIVILGNYIFLNEINKGIHIIDNRNPASPQNIAFIDIPGNIDLAVKGNILYADLYTDLVVLDITDPHNVIKTKIVEKVFPKRYYGIGFSADSNNVIYDWKRHDTSYIQDCTQPVFRGRPNSLYSTSGGSGSNNNLTIGVSGSMARFALAGDYLYTVGNTEFNVFNISIPGNPAFIRTSGVGWPLETIYPFKNNLFVGSTNGMFIYDIISAPDNPVRVAEFVHASACDPVIADDNYAYLTLRSGNFCSGLSNELDIVKLNNLSNAQFIKRYLLTNPFGLSKDGNLLFICDGTGGLKVYDAGDVQNLRLLKSFEGPEAYDVIAHNSIAIVIAKDGLYQYDYSLPNNIHLISKISISN